MKNNIQMKLGIILIIISSVIYLFLFAVPFLRISSSLKLTLVPVIVIAGELAFWAGAFFVGKELMKKYRSYLNPLNWFRKKKHKNDSGRNIVIRDMNSTDSERVLDIYKMGIDTGMATFEVSVPLWEDFVRNHHPHSRFVIELDGYTAGWAALSPVSRRDAYSGVAEVSIYIDTRYLGQGLGSLLFERLIESSEQNGIWTLFSSVFPENRASVKLHRRCGFRVIGNREKISRIDGKWRDTVILERRSRKL
jgi:L-amino acid N-acyltransferase YncA